MIESLKPGDFISPDVLERELGKFVSGVSTPLKRTDPEYGLALLRFKERVEALRPDLVCCLRHDGLRVLTEAEKAPYAAATRERGLRVLRRSAVICARTNRAALSAEDASRLDHETRINAGTAAAAIKERHRLAIDRMLEAPPKERKRLGQKRGS